MRDRVLRGLADGPVTAPDLAGDLDTTPAAVRDHVEVLRTAGVDIAASEAGYELRATPAYGPAVGAGLDGFDVEFHDSLDSTNRRARDLAGRGRENVVVLAAEQTGGRGRLDRDWASPRGGIWLSVLLRPPVPAAHAPVYTLAAAVAVTRAVREVGVDATIKWPNDVLVGGRKLAGVLTEAEHEGGSLAWLVVGVGLNANVAPATLPGDRPTSLRAECGDVDRFHLVRRLLGEFRRLSRDPESILPAWREHADTLGRRVRVETGDRTLVGEAVGVTFPGALDIDTGDGVETVAAGDCEHLRPTEKW